MQDKEMTEFLKAQYLKNKMFIQAEVNALKPNQYVAVRFYRDGQVKIKTFAKGAGGRFFECICGIDLTPERDVDEWANYAIESRVYRV